MEKEDGGSERSRRQKCPPQSGSSGATGEGQPLCEDENRLPFGEVTAPEKAAINQFLNAPAGTCRKGRAWTLARMALKLAGALLLAAGVVAGYADGNEFDEVGCSVAQRPGGASHGARSRQAQEDDGGTVPGASGSAGSAGGGGSAGRPECDVRAK